MLLTFQGYFEAGQFFKDDAAPIPDRKKAIVTILEDDADRDVQKKLAALREIDLLLEKSHDEEVPDFPRADLFRAREIEL